MGCHLAPETLSMLLRVQGKTESAQILIENARSRHEHRLRAHNLDEQTVEEQHSAVVLRALYAAGALSRQVMYMLGVPSQNERSS